MKYISDIFIFILLIFFISCNEAPLPKTSSNKSSVKDDKKIEDKKASENNDDDDDDDDDEPEGGVPSFETAQTGKCFNRDCKKNEIEDPNDVGKIFKIKGITYYNPLFIDYREDAATWKSDLSQYTNFCGARDGKDQRGFCTSVFKGSDSRSSKDSLFTVWQPMTSAAADADEILQDEYYRILGHYAKSFTGKASDILPKEPTAVIAIRGPAMEENPMALAPPYDYHVVYANKTMDLEQIQQQCQDGFNNTNSNINLDINIQHQQLTPTDPIHRFLHRLSTDTTTAHTSTPPTDTHQHPTTSNPRQRGNQGGVQGSHRPSIRTLIELLRTSHG